MQIVIYANPFAVLESQLLYFRWHEYGNKLKPNAEHVAQAGVVHDRCETSLDFD